ncbi:MAG: IS66 family transposase [Planctomycetes bacterium]|nr:IS66 family transposase [Planctomycetota bacterium]
MELQQALAELEEKSSALEQKDRQIETLSQQLQSREKTIAGLEHQLEQLLKRYFGPRSEKIDPNQLLFDSILLQMQEEAGNTAEDRKDEEEPDPPLKKKRKRTPHGRLPIPDHLEREEVILDVKPEEKICPVTGKEMICIGFEVSEKLEYRPGRLFVKVYKRPKYVSPERNNGVTGVLTAPMPDLPIAKCKADAGLLAYVVVSKFCDHLPLYRQEGIFEREGLRIPRSTQDGWILGLAESLWPLYEELKKAVLEGETLFTDDTVVRLIEPGLGKTRQARMWVYIRGGPGPPLVVFDFTKDRRKERPLEFLDDYQGYIHADAYSGYDELFNREGVIEVGCWAHTRRRFVEAMTSRPKEASEATTRIAELYKIEQEVRGHSPEERFLARQQHAFPRLDNLFERFDGMLVETTPAEPLTKAINYALNQRDALYRYTEDGRLEIDNNTAENAIRPLAVSRKNWLFAGSVKGGNSVALFLSLIESCRKNDLNPWEYLTDIFRRIMSHSASRLRELLPDQWKAGSQL